MQIYSHPFFNGSITDLTLLFFKKTLEPADCWKTLLLNSDETAPELLINQFCYTLFTASDSAEYDDSVYYWKQAA